MTSCPITPCVEVFERDESEFLLDHLYDAHDYDELATAVIRLAGAVTSAIANTECQRCGNYGATPGDHPLCPSCEEDVRG